MPYFQNLQIEKGLLEIQNIESSKPTSNIIQNKNDIFLTETGRNRSIEIRTGSILIQCKMGFKPTKNLIRIRRNHPEGILKGLEQRNLPFGKPTGVLFQFNGGL